MDMSKYRGMFLSESAEHLKNMNRLVVTLEGEPGNREVIDNLFREAHSIKGMAASMGYDRTAELAHHLEDLMDGFRKTGLVPPPVVDRVLAGVDLLEGLLADIEGESPEREIAHFLNAASTVAVTAAIAETPVIPEVTPAPEGKVEKVLEVVPTPGLRLLQIRIELAADASAPAARALLALREMARLGLVQGCHPEEALLRQGLPVQKLEVRFETAAAAEDIQKTLAAMADIHRVTVDEIGDRAAEGAGSRRDDGGRTVRVRTELLDRFINLTGELITTRYMLQAAAREERWGDTRDGLDLLARLIGDLHGHVLQVRMTPLESITGRLPRLVRDLARKSGKEVRLRIEGEDLELDRAILEELADPLVHMVRNAIDHGIERAGEVLVRAWREKDLAVVEIADNGRGMDPERIRRKALEKGLVSSAQLKLMRDRDLFQLVCLPGFSTAEAVTETSGRGVGMDVVKSAVESLGGTLEILSEAGAGTRFQLKLPLSVAIIKVLLVRCSGRNMGLPITRVIRALEVPKEDVKFSGHQRVIALGEEMVPLVELGQFLGLPVGESRTTLPTVVTEVHGRKVGLLVDSLAGQREVFIKTLAFPLNRISGLSGATVLGDGSVIFIIDPQTLLSPGAEMSAKLMDGA